MTNKIEVVRLPRVIELIRVSTRSQADADTPKSQHRALAEIAQGRPGKIIATIVAEDVSGKLRLDDSAEGRQLRKLADEGFDELRVADIDRVFGSRADDPRDRFGVWALVKDASAIFVDDFQVLDPADPDHERRFYESTHRAKLERLRILKRTRRGRKRVASEGKVSSRCKYGFCRPEKYVKGKRKATAPAPDPHTAPNAHRMYDLRSQGVSHQRIADALNADGIAGPTGGVWATASIVRILHDPAFKGRYSYNDSVFDVEPIVSEELWNAVQEQSPRRGRKTNVSNTLCLGMVKCRCGRSAYGLPSGNRIAFYYACKTIKSKDPTEHCEYAQRIHSADVDVAVWEAIRDIVSDPKIIEASIDETNTVEVDGYREQLKQCEKRLAQSSKHVQTTLRDHRRGLLTESQREIALKEIAKERVMYEDTAELARQHINATDTMRRHRALLKRQLTELSGLIADCKPEHRRKVVKALVGFQVVLIDESQVEVRFAMPVKAANEAGSASSEGNSAKSQWGKFGRGGCRAR